MSCACSTMKRFEAYQVGEIMNMNPIGKFEMSAIVREFDDTLIRLFGVNMLDAAISRHEAISAFNEFQCPRKAAEISGRRRGLSAETA